MKLLKTLDSFLNKIEAALLIILLSVMVVLAFAQVIFRNLFSSGILWGDVLLRHLVLWIGFFGAALAVSSDRHINIDALTRFLSPRVRSAISILTNFFAAAVCYLLFRGAITFINNEIADKTTVYAEIPSWYAEIIIPVGFGLLVVHFIVRAVLHGQEAMSKEQPQ